MLRPFGRSMSRHQLDARELKKGRVRADAFFETVMPVLFETRAAIAAGVGRRFAFELTGAGGGSWTIDCMARTVRAAIGDADVVVRMPAASFEAMLAGALDVDASLRAGTISLVGERRWLRALAALAAPEQFHSLTRIVGDEVRP